MISLPSDGDTAAEDQHALYKEFRGLGFYGWLAVGVVVVPALYIGVPLARTQPSELWEVAAFFGVMLLAALILLVSPLAFTFGWLHISGAGLKLWPLGLSRLPVADLGDVEIIREDEAVVAARQGRWRGTRIPTGRSSYSRWGGDGPAVFVEQYRPGKDAVGWLLATREPEVVIDALTEVRDAHRPT